MAYTALYSGANLGDMFIDLFGAILNGLVDNAGTIVILFIVALIAGIGAVALGRMFGLFTKIKL